MAPWVHSPWGRKSIRARGVIINYTFYAADRKRLGTVFIQHRKIVQVWQNLIQQTVNSVRAYSCWICCPFYKISKLRESKYIYPGCLVSAFNIFVQLMFTWYQSTIFRAVHSVDFITVSFSRKISLSRQDNDWLSNTLSSLLKFSVHYRERGYVLWNVSTALWPTSPRSTIYLYISFSSFFNLWLSSIPDPRFSILIFQ